MALFVTNPLRVNGAKDRMVAKAMGITLGQAKKLKSRDYDAYQAAYAQAGGSAGLESWKERGRASRQAVKSGELLPRGLYYARMKAAAAPAEQHDAHVMARHAFRGMQDRPDQSPYGTVLSQALARGYSMDAAHAAARSATGRRRNPFGGLALRTNPFGGLAVRTNPFGGLALRTNPFGGLGVVAGTMDMATNAVAGVPFVGGALAPLVTPVVMGAAVAGVHYVAVRYAVEPLLAQSFVPEAVRTYIAPVTYTATGLAVAGLTAATPRSLLTREDKELIAGTAVTVGVAFDLFRAIQSRFGAAAAADPVSVVMDAVAAPTDVSGLGYEGVGLNLGDIYGDASMGDAAYCGDDFDAAEQRALVQGPGVWLGRFGTPGLRRGAAADTGRSRHAGQHGHRWGWLIRLVGVNNAMAVAAMPASKRKATIRALRAQALSTVQSALADSGNVGADDLSGTFGGARGADGATGYGALIFAGE